MGKEKLAPLEKEENAAEATINAIEREIQQLEKFIMENS
jgi:hypothetical protein